MNGESISNKVDLSSQKNNRIAPHPIHALEKIRLGGSEQWIRIQGKDTSNPVLLLIQQGPGLPMLNEARDAEKQLNLEEEFVVVYWDQRGCGKSFRSGFPPQSLTLEQMIADTHELIQALTQRFSMSRLFVTGFSQGGTIAALTASRYPENIQAVICVAPEVLFAESERIAYEFALKQAAQRGNRRAMQELREIGLPPHLDSKTFGIRLKWLTNFGGVYRHKTYRMLLLQTLRQILLSRDYSFTDILGTLRGIGFVQDHLLPNLVGLDLFHGLPWLEVPIFFFQGRQDRAAPVALVERYYQGLQAPKGKQLIWFDKSAHEPHYEEPAKFREAMFRIKQSLDKGGEVL